MLNSALVGLMRQNRSLLFATSSAQQAATRGLYYENARFRNKRYRSASRQMAKEKKRQRMAGQKSVQESGEEIPQFFNNPQRTKLMFKMVEDSKNNVRIFRKPMPPEVKAEFARKSKEYHSFKAIERNEIEKELNAQLKVQLKALDACTHLPDYLMDEVFGEDGSMREEDMNEFKPSIVYMEQMLRLFPREITAKWKLFPAFEETFMRMEESRNQSEAGGN